MDRHWTLPAAISCSRRPIRPSGIGAAMTQAHLTPLSAADSRPAGMLLDACFNNRPDSRPQDAVTSAEFIVGSYFLLHALMIADGRIEPGAF
jgi:hypothetical protein